MKSTFLNHDLEYFLQIGEKRTLLQASESLGISQPALSRSLDRLESHLGFKILKRSRSGIQMTEQGLVLYRQSQRAKDQIQNFIEALRSGESEFHGRVRIGAHSCLLQDFLMPLLPDLLEQFPRIQFEFVSKPSSEVIPDLLAEKLEMGLVMNPALYSNLILKPVLQTQALFYSETKETLRFFMHPQMIDLAKIMKILRRQGLDERNLFFISDYDLIAQAVQKKLGWGLLPSHVADRFQLKPAGSFLNSYRLTFQMNLAINHNHQSDKMRTLMKYIDSKLK